MGMGEHLNPTALLTSTVSIGCALLLGAYLIEATGLPGLPVLLLAMLVGMAVGRFTAAVLSPRDDGDAL